MKNQDKILLGKVNGFHGIKGFVKIFSETRPREAIFDYEEWLLFYDNKWSLHKIEISQVVSKSLIVKFEEFNNRDEVEHLLNTQIAVTNEQLPILGEDRYYWTDLIGISVKSIEGIDFGKVESLMETGANDVLVVKGQFGSILIPFTLKKAIVNVDLDAQLILVDWDVDEN